MKTDLKVNAKFPVGAFSAGVEFKRISNSANSKLTVYTEATAVCLTYYASILQFIKLNISESFRNAITYAKVEPDDYYNILDTFGSHYTSGLGMGSKCVLQSEFTNDAWYVNFIFSSNKKIKN